MWWVGVYLISWSANIFYSLKIDALLQYLKEDIGARLMYVD
jgi:hypothetical protein